MGRMYFLFVVALVFRVPSLLAADSHLQESGSAPIISRSAFAHGYRHGYEQGFHQGNIDANMSRPPKSRPAQFKGMPSGYESAFGPRKSFEQGFSEGLKAGYGDGYAGCSFRAVGLLREAGASLDANPPSEDPANLNFDRGVALGYRNGFDRAASGPSEAQLDASSVNCPGDSAADPAAQPALSFCDGYRRGYTLGHADGLAVLSQRKILEASQ
ncbi:MAG TPA: hypothetical protein VF532_18040 [Candidatus Angelobacter sp.]